MLSAYEGNWPVHPRSKPVVVRADVQAQLLHAAVCPAADAAYTQTPTPHTSQPRAVHMRETGRCFGDPGQW